ncbi:copper/zinc superoxide dismutase isoform 3 [Penaeus vannamei]|uniref:Superoxide dismutase [Cu-Zn] n=1 Tax=Penaeus vannamei TaxID=6689 RepID=A0A3R7PF03_PENVA|nr:copper/zinc superoxide dismutase isoform 3 [Penaeus vannamei]
MHISPTSDRSRARERVSVAVRSISPKERLILPPRSGSSFPQGAARPSPKERLRGSATTAPSEGALALARAAAVGVRALVLQEASRRGGKGAAGRARPQEASPPQPAKFSHDHVTKWRPSSLSRISFPASSQPQASLVGREARKHARLPPSPLFPTSASLAMLMTRSPRDALLSCRMANSGPDRRCCGTDRGPSQRSHNRGRARRAPGNQQSDAVATTGPDAVVDIVPGSNPNIRGALYLYRRRSGGVDIHGTVGGLKPGLHGFHVHAEGNLGDSCKAAGGHFNPLMKNHGSPLDFHRHAGDLGNVIADYNGVARISLFDRHISLDWNSPVYIGGLAFVIHAGEDDLGRGGDAESLKTGNAGGREGCGIVRVAQAQRYTQTKYY